MNASTGPGLLGFLALLFIGLRLGGVIDWSWWLVLLPLYGPAALCLTVAVVLFLAGCLLGGIVKVLEK